MGSNHNFGPTLASLTSINATTVIQGVIEVSFDIKNSSKSDEVECKINLSVEAGTSEDHGERFLATQIINCEAKNFTFIGLRPASNHKLRVCAFLDFGPTLHYHTDSKCSYVISNQIAVAEPATLQPRRPITHKAPILALVLTLVFLGIGIAALVVLYLIVKGYLSDRHKAELFHMRFCHMNNNNNVQSNPRPASLWMRWTHRFFLWRHYHVHRPVPASDEMVLREDSTFDTS